MPFMNLFLSSQSFSFVPVSPSSSSSVFLVLRFLHLILHVLIPQYISRVGLVFRLGLALLFLPLLLLLLPLFFVVSIHILS